MHLFSSFRARTLCLLGLTLLPVAACGGADAPVAEEGELNESLAVIPGPEAVRCWVEPGQDPDPFFRVDRLLSRQRPMAGFPLALHSITVQADTADRKVGSSELTGAESGDVVMSVGRDSYPIAVSVKLHIDRQRSELLGLSYGPSGLSFLEDRFSIASPQSLLQSAPHIAKVPFDVWPIRVKNRVKIFNGHLSPYPLELAPLMNNQRATKANVAMSLPVLTAFDQSTKFNIPVTPGTESVLGTATSMDNTVLEFSLTGPGSYVAEDKGLRRLTGEEQPTGEGPSLAHCWTAPVEGGSDVLCKLETVPGITTKVQSTVTVAGTASDPVPLEASPDPIRVATLKSTDLPATVRLSFTLDGKLVGIPTEAMAAPFVTEFEVADPLAQTSDKPVRIGLPFVVWQVDITSDARFFLINLDTYTIELAREWAGHSAFLVENTRTPILKAGAMEPFFMAVTPGTKTLGGRALYVASTGAQLKYEATFGPGAYTATKEKLEPRVAPTQ